MKKFLICFSLVVLLVMGSYSMFEMSKLPRTYDGKNANVYSLYESVVNGKEADNYNLDDADGVSSIMVKQNLERTRALNAVTAIVFDYRGYDTLGESFILLTAISGSVAILRKGKGKEGK